MVSEEKRLRILNLLTQKEMCVGEIMTALDASQSLVSHHLAVLRDVGLVRYRRDAQWIYYSIDSKGLAELNESYLQLLDIEHSPRKTAYGANPTKH